MASEETLAATFVDTHITATLAGVVIGEILSFISFDIRLVRALVLRRRFAPMPVAYLLTRYTMLLGITVLVWVTFPIIKGTSGLNYHAVHWLRGLLLPVVFASTSAILGYRTLVLPFEHPKIVSFVIHTLLFCELVGGISIMCLSVADPTKQEPHQELSARVGYVSPAWICAPLMIAMLIDAIFTLIVVISVLFHKEKEERPKKGQVIHMLLSDAIFFGISSIVVKAVAVGLTLLFVERNTNPYLPVRMAGVSSAIFACRTFRGQELFLKELKDKQADPELEGIDVEERVESDVSRRTSFSDALDNDIIDTEAALSGEVEEKESLKIVATVTLTDCGQNQHAIAGQQD